VDIQNYTKIQTVAGELKIYKSVDEGSNYYLDKFLALKIFISIIALLPFTR
jgi:hypothetical protein